MLKCTLLWSIKSQVHDALLNFDCVSLAFTLTNLNWNGNWHLLACHCLLLMKESSKPFGPIRYRTSSFMRVLFELIEMNFSFVARHQ